MLDHSWLSGQNSDPPARFFQSACFNLEAGDLRMRIEVQVEPEIAGGSESLRSKSLSDASAITESPPLEGAEGGSSLVAFAFRRVFDWPSAEREFAEMADLVRVGRASAGPLLARLSRAVAARDFSSSFEPLVRLPLSPHLATALPPRLAAGLRILAAVGDNVDKSPYRRTQLARLRLRRSARARSSRRFHRRTLIAHSRSRVNGRFARLPSPV